MWYLNESRVGCQESVWKLIRCVDSVKDGVDVIILNKVTATCTQKMDSTREYAVGLVLSNQVHNFGLVLLVVIQLLGQWNSTLYNPQETIMQQAVKKKSCNYMLCRRREREIWISLFTYNWAVLSYRPEAAEAKLTPVRMFLPVASWLRYAGGYEVKPRYSAVHTRINKTLPHETGTRRWRIRVDFWEMLPVKSVASFPLQNLPVGLWVTKSLP